MILQQQQELPQSNEELCNLLIQSLIAKDEKSLQKVLEQEDEDIIRSVISRIPVNHVKNFIIQLRDILSIKLTPNHLIWLQNLLALKYTVISSMADGRSILTPLISLLDDRSSTDYYNKMLGLKGKITLLQQLREVRRSDTNTNIVTVQVKPDQPTQMEVDSETDTDSEEDLDNEQVIDEDEDTELKKREVDDEEEDDDEDDDESEEQQDDQNEVLSDEDF